MSQKSAKDKERNDGISRLINYGTEIASGAVGGALGFLIGGPVGSVIGGASGPIAAIMLRSIGQEISERHLGTREKVRVGAAFAIAAADIRQRIENGENVRTDGFFDENQTGRSAAEEVAESVLLKAQREPEEKKIQYMGFLLSSITFDPHINVHTAHQLVKTVEQLTYRQLCILKLSVVKDKFEMRDKATLNRMKMDKDLNSVLDECIDLNNREYIYFGNAIVISRAGVTPGSMRLVGLGRELFNLMKLYLIPDEDIVPIAVQLK